MNKKIAVITGASRGIGKTVALNLAKQDYHVVLVARSKDRLDKVKQEIIDMGNDASSYVVDVANAAEVRACINEVIANYKRINFLFNNAGVWYGGTSEIKFDELNQMLDINLRGAIYVANAVAEQMKKQQSGYIINVSSSAGKENEAPILFAMGGYAASKFGLSGYSEALYKELLPYKVKVTGLCSSFISTDMTRAAKIPQVDMIQPSDIVKTINYLLSLEFTASIREIVVACTEHDIIVAKAAAKALL